MMFYLSNVTAIQIRIAVEARWVWVGQGLDGDSTNMAGK